MRARRAVCSFVRAKCEAPHARAFSRAKHALKRAKHALTRAKHALRALMPHSAHIFSTRLYRKALSRKKHAHLRTKRLRKGLSMPLEPQIFSVVTLAPRALGCPKGAGGWLVGCLLLARTHPSFEVGWFGAFSPHSVEPRLQLIKSIGSR